MILDFTARVLLLPVLLGQAIYVRVRALKLPEPPGDRHGVIGSGPPLRLLIIGDSSAAGVGVPTQDQALLGLVSQRLASVARVEYRLVARTGAKTGEVLGWLDDLPERQYDIVILALGVNDVTKVVPLRRWLVQTARLIDRFTAEFGARRVVLSGLPPVHQFPLLPQPLRWVLGRQAGRFDRHLRDMVASRPTCRTVRVDVALGPHNMSADGFHPGPAVYAAWADAICDSLLDDPRLLDPACGRP